MLRFKCHRYRSETATEYARMKSNSILSGKLSPNHVSAEKFE